WVQATRSAAGVPLGAFAGVLAAAARSDDPLTLIARGAESLRELAGDRQLVLGIDDAQLLDDSSAALVLELALRFTAFVVVTIRAGEPCPDAVRALSKDAGAVVLELGALSAQETETLAEDIAGGPIEEGARRWIYDTSLGNALYARELTLGALAGGALTEVDRLWRMPVRPPVSATLAELITVRMTGLTEPERHALELLALGEPLRLPDVIELAGSETLTRLEARGLVTVADGSRQAEVTLAHPLYGETIRAALPAFRARQTRLALARVVGERVDADPMRVARWLFDAGEEIAVSVLVEGAQAAILSGDPGLAVSLAQRAVDSGAGIRAALLLARAHTVQNEYEQAAAVLTVAEADIDGQESAVQFLEQSAEVLYWGLRRPEEFDALLTRAEGWWEGPEWQRRLYPIRLYDNSPVPVSQRTEATSRALAAEDVEREVEHRVAPVHAANLFYSGRAREAFELARRIRPSVPLRDLSDELAFVIWSAIAIESGLGWSELDTWATAALSDGVRLGDRAAAGRGALALGGLRFSQGRFADARRWLVEAEVQLERRDSLGLLAITYSMRVGVACFTGELEAIKPTLERCLQALGGHDPLPNQLPYIVRAQAWAVNALGDPAGAQDMFVKAADRLSEMPVFAGRLCYEALRAGRPPRAVIRRLQAFAQATDAPLTAAYAAHCAALAAGDGQALLNVASAM
ncbi:MAG: hypothetical protein WAK93_08220, partial [Solirubrobacteraceae bacterium]